MSEANSWGRTAAQAWQPIKRLVWLSVPLWAFVFVVPLLILALGESRHWVGATLAYINVLIGSAFIFSMARHGTIGSMIPCLFLPFILVGTCIGTIYFTLSMPEARYTTFHGSTPMLWRSVQMQVVTGTFLLVYMAVYRLLYQPPTTYSGANAPFVLSVNPRLAYFACAGGIVMFATYAATRILELPPALDYVANGMYLYMIGWFFAVGAMAHAFSRTAIFLILVIVSVVGSFYLLGNARGTALSPIVMIAFGVLLLGHVRERVKLVGLQLSVVAFVVVLVIGNTTRNVLGSHGFENIWRRLEVMGRWQEAFSQPIFGQVFGRLWPTAGHTIITNVPGAYPYMHFDFETFFSELIVRILVPGSVYYNPTYSHTGVLLPLGFNISKTTSVEVTTMGSLWFLGGWFPLLIGAVGLAAVHALVSLWLDRAARVSPARAVFYLSMIAWQVMWSHNHTIIQLLRSLIAAILAALLLYHLFLRWFFETPEPQPQPADEYPLLNADAPETWAQW